jgi:hypothetical protein
VERGTWKSGNAVAKMTKLQAGDSATSNLFIKQLHAPLALPTQLLIFSNPKFRTVRLSDSDLTLSAIPLSPSILPGWLQLDHWLAIDPASFCCLYVVHIGYLAFHSIPTYSYFASYTLPRHPLFAIQQLGRHQPPRNRKAVLASAIPFPRQQ